MLSWEQYFINIARAVSLRSKDPKTKVGCVIIAPDKHIISTGYNGCPPGFPETPEMWNSEQKHDYVIHAEMNALLHAPRSVKGASLFTTMFPCKECAKSIASAGISQVYYQDIKYYNEIAVKLFSEAGIKLEKVENK